MTFPKSMKHVEDHAQGPPHGLHTEHFPDYSWYVKIEVREYKVLEDHIDHIHD